MYIHVHTYVNPYDFVCPQKVDARFYKIFRQTHLPMTGPPK